MDSSLHVQFKINTSWDILKSTREKIEQYLKSQNEALCDATKMTASELLENAIKYGTLINGVYIEFECKSEADQIIIKVSNGVTSQQDLENLKSVIQKIQESNDPEKLYTHRLMELLENPRQGESRLGLYRIAYEAEFHLSYVFEKNILTVTAKRNYEIGGGR